MAVAGESASLLAAPATALSVKLTLPILVAEALTVLEPAMVPSVRFVEALPALSVTAVRRESVPPPAVNANVTTTPGKAVPLRAFTFTTKGSASGVATTPVCLLPLAIEILCACAGIATSAANSALMRLGQNRKLHRASRQYQARIVLSSSAVSTLWFQ